MKQLEQMQARDLYLNQGKTQTEITQMLKVDRKTVYTWIKSGNWEEMKTARELSPAVVAQDIYNHIEAIIKHVARRPPERCFPCLTETVMLTRLMSMAKNQQHGSVGSYIQAYEELINTMLADDVAQAKATMEYTQQIISNMLPGKRFYTKEERPPLVFPSKISRIIKRPLMPPYRGK